MNNDVKREYPTDSQALIDIPSWPANRGTMQREKTQAKSRRAKAIACVELMVSMVKKD